MEYNIAKIRDKIRIYEKSGKAMATNFLTPAEVSEVYSMLRGYEHVISGGFEEAERRIIIIGTQEPCFSEFCTVIRVECFNGILTHRAVLGSVLGLGIKREMIGDIIAKEKICDIIVMREMKEYILNNLNKVGREKVKTCEVAFEDLLNLDSNKVTKNISVASLRIDAVVSVAFGIAREKSASLISLEKVLINYLPCTNSSKSIKPGDLLSVRGFGRVKILDVLGETKKGRVRVCVEIY